MELRGAEEGAAANLRSDFLSLNGVGVGRHTLDTHGASDAYWNSWVSNL